MTPDRVTAEEHLGWCKEQAFGYLDRGDAVGAVTAMCSGMRRHPGTANHAGLPLLVTLAAEGRLAGPGNCGSSSRSSAERATNGQDDLDRVERDTLILAACRCPRSASPHRAVAGTRSTGIPRLCT